MKTKTLSLIGLVLVFALAWPAAPSLAAKGGGGNHGKPEPPPEPTTPFVYQRVEIQPQPDQLYNYTTWSINDQGVVAGTYASTDNPEGVFAMLPPTIAGTNVSYQAADAVVLGTNEAPAGGYFLYINNNNQVAGSYFTWADEAITNNWYDSDGNLLFTDIFTNKLYRAVLWNNGGSRQDLWSPIKTDLSRTCAINGSGWVLVVNCKDDAVDHYTIEAVQESYVVVPIDVDGDGVAETWYVDNNGDDINDLAYLLDVTGYPPNAIGEDGIIVFDAAVLLPDFDDADGDGNPWFADANGDGDNDLILDLRPLEDTGIAGASDINDFGEIVGRSSFAWDDTHAVVWSSYTDLPIDLGQPTRHTIQTYGSGINNAGQIIGHYYEKPKGNGGNPQVIEPSTYYMYYEGTFYNFPDLTTDGSGWGLRGLNENGWIVSEYGEVFIPIVHP